MITKEQEDEFKKRKAEGPKYSNEVINYNGAKITKKQMSDFLKVTDEKCK